VVFADARGQIGLAILWQGPLRGRLWRDAGAIVSAVARHLAETDPARRRP
jgi:hypothetical protein